MEPTNQGLKFGVEGWRASGNQHGGSKNSDDARPIKVEIRFYKLLTPLALELQTAFHA